MKLLYCARCTTPLMSAATVLVCPCCGAAYRQRGTRFSFTLPVAEAHAAQPLEAHAA